MFNHLGWRSASAGELGAKPQRRHSLVEMILNGAKLITLIVYRGLLRPAPAVKRIKQRASCGLRDRTGAVFLRWRFQAAGR